MLGGSLIGESVYPYTWSPTDDPRGTSVAFFCPDCGDIWGRVFTPSRSWMVATVGCERHPQFPSFHPGGSFILEWNRGAIDKLPHAVLRREFRLHLHHAKARNDFENTLFSQATAESPR